MWSEPAGVLQLPGHPRTPEALDACGLTVVGFRFIEFQLGEVGLNRRSRVFDEFEFEMKSRACFLSAALGSLSPVGLGFKRIQSPPYTI